ncbi:MAG: hypothetical protein UR18_C0006G0032 [Candidatus Nomurabacteria bacterium GW2011_GWE2_31_40]|nr:MAG: hypothetical protein UR18_C0006G0032 [Candidatus Nomurabacteria bacterium GW2011_GWE2_31_40]OGV06192.1 MAG: hypothetical protein A2299_12200 [Stygiobacter sp. RIFOXYB2_FULL_37_11]OGV15942.1 MAG: hypothetical protein A2440_03130 [Stygiobacter sp. RIFOXYC2_FULL_38_25]OGV27886.1 MAG: hypothetical protein A2499_17235 [Stygiobacter sp. RIFOXYC12_FULL_38_8]OGV80419.1 MAG: hypothetical protein A2X65_04290 [Stygiobacter sp. GWF2_38_21]
MTCRNCGLDYKEDYQNDFKIVMKTYDSYGLPFIHRVRACPHCNDLSLTVEKHTGEKGYPTVEIKEVFTLNKVLFNSTDLWIARYPGEIKLITQIKKLVE